MEKIINYFKGSGRDIYESLKMLIFWLVMGIGTGIVVGFTGVAFHYSIDILAEFRTENMWVIFLLPLGGLAVVFLYSAAGMKDDKGTNAVILAIREHEHLPFRTAVLIFVSTVITHFLGGSSGREGAALQIGGSLAATESRIFGLDEKQQKILVMSGMSACFSALFGTPVTAAIFSIEVISVGIMHYSAVIPCVTASIAAFKVSTKLGVVPTSFHIMRAPSLNADMFLELIPFAVVCALICRLFCFSMSGIRKLFSKYIKNRYLRVTVGYMIIIAMTLAEGNQTFNGAGGEIIVKSFSERSEYYYFIHKIIFTAVTLGCGFKGGEIIPAFFVGSTFGSFVSPYFGIDFSFGAGVGLIALFCGATNCPIASLLMSIELFGIDAVPYFALVCGISYLISGDTGLYGEQKIMYSRMMPEYVNKTLKGSKKTKE